MAWDPEANDLFPQQVTLTAPGALNDWGRKAAGASPTTVNALVEYKMRQVRNIKGDLAASSITVYLSGEDGLTNVATDWTITLPDGTSRPIMAVDRYPDEDGTMLEVVRLQ